MRPRLEPEPKGKDPSRNGGGCWFPWKVLEGFLSVVAWSTGRSGVATKQQESKTISQSGLQTGQRISHLTSFRPESLWRTVFLLFKQWLDFLLEDSEVVKDCRKVVADSPIAWISIGWWDVLPTCCYEGWKLGTNLLPPFFCRNQETVGRFEIDGREGDHLPDRPKRPKIASCKACFRRFVQPLQVFVQKLPILDAKTV